MKIQGVIPVIPTPFRDGRFDLPSFERLLDHMLPFVDGYVLLGSTGEAPSMDLAERQAIAAAALELSGEKMTVVVGVTDTSLANTIALCQHAEAHGAAGVLCASPFYFPNSVEGLRRHLGAIDAALEGELVFYDNPPATKTQVSASDVVAWAEELEHLRTVKLTDHDLSKIAVWQQAGLGVMAGDDPIAFQYLAEGVDGAMIIAPCVFPEAFRAAWDRAQAGDLTGAFDIFGPEIAPFSHIFGIGDEIATTKAVLADLGIFTSAEVRSPLTEVDAARTSLLRSAYDIGTAQGSRRATAARTG
jgi:4-hydroxy-tetrahydrodipicolinate synthase